MMNKNGMKKSNNSKLKRKKDWKEKTKLNRKKIKENKKKIKKKKKNKKKLMKLNFGFKIIHRILLRF